MRSTVKRFIRAIGAIRVIWVFSTTAHSLLVKPSFFFCCEVVYAACIVVATIANTALSTTGMPTTLNPKTVWIQNGRHTQITTNTIQGMAVFTRAFGWRDKFLEKSYTLAKRHHNRFVRFVVWARGFVSENIACKHGTEILVVFVLKTHFTLGLDGA